MHRDGLLKLVNTYSPVFSEEKIYRDKILDFIQSHPDCFNRSCSYGHITASSFLLSYDGASALLMHHSKLNMWLQLGGHCDGDNDVIRVALKEAQEESGIMPIKLVRKSIFDIDVHLVPDNDKEHAHYHYDIRFLFRIDDEDAVASKNSESLELKWFANNISELPTRERSIVRLFEKWGRL